MIEIALGSALIIGLILALALGLLAARSRLVPDVALSVTVNGGQVIAAKRGAKLLEVLQGADIPVPAACGGSGSCGQCRVTATGPGAGELRATERGLLSASERRADVRLACQLNLRGSVEVTVAPDILSAGAFTCTVASNRMLAPHPLPPPQLPPRPAGRAGYQFPRRRLHDADGTALRARLRPSRNRRRA